MTVTVSPGPPDRPAVLELAARVEAEDGAPPLSDQTLSLLGTPGATEFVALDGGELIGYAQVADGSLEIAARPDAIDALLDCAGDGGSDGGSDAEGVGVSVWSHGRDSRLVGALEARGYLRARELHQLRRMSIDLPPDPPLAADVTVRAFVPGRDDRAWLALNAAAFAHHPEQGRLTQDDLTARIAEAWFEAAGFLLAERAGELIGFHWTKVHPDGLGEVYVLGVAPAGQGLGLGGALLVRGLRHLIEQRHCPGVLLYVDGDNPGALHLYERNGFDRFDTDVQWRRPSS